MRFELMLFKKNKSVFKTDVLDHSTIYPLKHNIAEIGLEPIFLEYEPKELPLLYPTWNLWISGLEPLKNFIF